MKILNKVIVLILIIMLQTGMAIEVFGNSTGGNIPQPDRKRGDTPPSLNVDNTSSTANTGGMFNFSVNFTDDFTISEVYVNYTYGVNFYYNISMNNVIDDIWNCTITIDQSALTLDYYFFYKDNASNINVTQLKRVTILDTIPPVSDAGDDVVVPQFGVLWFDGSGSEDNRGIVNYTWFWWCHFCHVFKYAYGEIVNMTWFTGRVDNITLNLSVMDAAGNQDIDTKIVDIRDRESPIADAGNELLIVDQFQIVYFNAYSSWDNIEITNYTWMFYDNNTMITLYGIAVNYTFSIPGEYNITLMVTDGEGNIGPSSWYTIRLIVLNISIPEVNAGEDVEIDQRMTVVFNGSGSSEVVNFLWNFTHNGVMQYLEGISPEFRFTTAGVYLVTLNVSDWAGRWNMDTMIVTVRDIDPPVAKAGKDQEVLLGEKFVLNGSNSWDMVAIVNFFWNFHYNGTDHVLYGEEMIFTFDYMGIYDITLRVEDEEGNYGTDVCTITTIDGKEPDVDAGFDIIIDEGGIAYMNGSRTTDHSAIVNYSWALTINEKEHPLYGKEVSYEFEIPGTYTVFLFVKDVWGNEGWDSLLVRVKDVTPPTADAKNNITTTEGKTVILNASGWDNVDIMSYNWSFYYNGEERELFGKVVDFIFELAGNYTIYLTVLDEDGNMGNDSIWVNVNALLTDDDSSDDDDVDDDNNDENTQTSNSLKIMISVGVIVIFVVIYLITLISRRRKEQQSSMSSESRENERVGEKDEEEEDVDDTMEESLKETEEEDVKDTVEEDVEDPGVEAVEETLKDGADESMVDAIEESVKETEEEGVDDTVEEGVDDPGVEAVEETVEDAGEEIG